MIWIIILVGIITYARSLANAAISDDITVNSALRKENYPLRWRQTPDEPKIFIHDLLWRLLKENSFLHHLLNVVLFISLAVSFYVVAQKYIPENVAFLASLIFIVHPCNCQVGGWISGKWFGVALLIGLWALYFDSIALYLLTPLFSCNVVPLPILMDVSIPTKIISICLSVLILFRVLNKKGKASATEGIYKRDNLRFHPKKIIIAVKSFAYYFTLALFPVRSGWFHEIGEPVDDKLKSFDLHFYLSLGLICCCLLFFIFKRPEATGLFLLILFLLPFINLITFALFTSERYMTPAIMGWSIFLSYVLINYPVVAAVVITAYFMKTQLELWAYRDDFTLALYSLLNFSKSGFAWANVANYFLISKRPSAAYDTLQEAVKQCPEFPTTYYQLYLMHRATDLLCDYDKAMEYLEKACRYGGHENWYVELEKFKELLKRERVKKFVERYASKYPQVREPGRPAQPATSDDRSALVGITA